MVGRVYWRLAYGQARLGEVAAFSEPSIVQVTSESPLRFLNNLKYLYFPVLFQRLKSCFSKTSWRPLCPFLLKSSLWQRFFNKAHFLPLSSDPHDIPVKQTGPFHTYMQILGHWEVKGRTASKWSSYRGLKPMSGHPDSFCYPIPLWSFIWEGKEFCTRQCRAFCDTLTGGATRASLVRWHEF